MVNNTPENVKSISFTSKDPKVSLTGHHFIPLSLKSDLVCVLVHPWGVLGGSEANTYPVARLLTDRFGIECITFNLRGVATSSGTATYTCIAEVQDVLGACAWVASNIKRPCVLVGSSAGAAIAGSALDQVDNCKAYIGIGYTFGRIAGIVFGSHFDAIINSSKPKLFIMGSSDGFTSVSQLKTKTALMRNSQYRIVQGAGHFELESGTHTHSIAEIVANFVMTIM